VGLGLVLDLAGFPIVAIVTAALLLSALPGVAVGIHEGQWKARKPTKSGSS
jgi:hypothetical protein